MQKILFILAFLSPVIPMQAYDLLIDGIYYNIIVGGNKELEVTNCSNIKYVNAITIPSSVNFNDVIYSVTGIGNKAFYGCSGLTQITIPESVTSIGYNAFYYCSRLSNVYIPNTVTSIGDYAFQNCSGLTEITIPESVTSIGESAFKGCTSLMSLNYNAINCTSIGNFN